MTPYRYAITGQIVASRIYEEAESRARYGDDAACYHMLNDGLVRNSFQHPMPSRIAWLPWRGWMAVRE